MKKIALLIAVSLFLVGCATPTLDRLMYEDQLSANQRNYLLYRASTEYANQDKKMIEATPDPILSKQDWLKTRCPDKFVERYERTHNINH